MSDEGIKRIGFKTVADNMQSFGIKIDDKELQSTFDELKAKSKDGSVNVEEMTSYLMEKHKLSDKDIVKVLDEVTGEVVQEYTSKDIINNSLSVMSNLDEDGKNISSFDIEASNDEDFQYEVVLKSGLIDDKLTESMDNLIDCYEENFDKVLENNGLFDKGVDKIKNFFNAKTGSNSIKKELEDIKTEVEELKKGNGNISDIYERLTGNKLDGGEVKKLFEGEVEYSNSKYVQEISKYEQKQGTSSTVAAGVAGTGTMIAMVAGGVVAAPFTGGASLGASIAAIGALTAVGGTAYFATKEIDSLGKDNYLTKTPDEFNKDVLEAYGSMGITAVGLGAGGAIGQGLAKTVGFNTAKLLSSEATAIIIGDGISLGNYTIETAFNDDVDFSIKDFTKIAAVSTGASLAAGAMAYGVGSAVGNIAANATAQSSAVVQIGGKIATGAIAGAGAGAGATAVAGGMNYLLQSKETGENVTLEGWLDATSENIAQGAIMGSIAGIAFEAVQVASGVQAPNGTARMQEGKTEEGLQYKEYLDKNGDIIARDYKASDIQKLMQEEGLVEYDSNSFSSKTNTRTVRINIENKSANLIKNGINYDVEAKNTYVTEFDWINNPKMSYGAKSDVTITENSLQNNTNEQVFTDKTSLSALENSTELAIEGTVQNEIIQNQPNDLKIIAMLIAKPMFNVNLQYFAGDENFDVDDIEGYHNDIFSELLAKANTKIQESKSELNDEQLKTYDELEKIGLPKEIAITIAKSNTPLASQRVVELLDKGVDDYLLEELVTLNSSQYERAIQFLNDGMKADYVKDFVSLDEKQFQRYEKYKNETESYYNQLEITKLSDKTYARFEDFMSKGNGVDMSLKLLTYSDEELAKIDNLTQKNGIKYEEAMYLVKKSDVDMNYQAELLERKLPFEKIWLMRGYKEEDYIRLKELLDNGADINQAIDAATSEIEYQLVLTSLENKSSDMRSFFNDDSYLSKLKEVTQGNYQTQLMKMLNPKTMPYGLKKQFLDSNFTEQQYLDSIKKIAKSTYKLAMNTPNQYLSYIDIEYTTKVNGHYPKLSDDVMKIQQERVTEFFENNLIKITKALQYVDTDTINQMMDKRTAIFQKSLDDLCELDDDNFNLLKDLIKCKNGQTSKELTAKDKIQLCQIVEIYQKSELDTSNLLKMSKTGTVNIDEAKQEIQNAILKKAGVTDEQLATIPKEKIKLNEEFSYLALAKNPIYSALQNAFQSKRAFEATKQQIAYWRTMDLREFEQMVFKMERSINAQENANLMDKESYKANLELIEMYKNIDKYTDEEIAKKTLSIAKQNSIQNEDECMDTVIRESVLGDFKEFISDESNKYGETNAKTKKAFENEGLNYDKWLNPDIEDVKINVVGKDFTIKLWDRNPLEDLFIGNKTSCCTAIGTGLNGKYTAAYLANTSFNIVELYDDNGNAIGMSRVFMGKIDGKNALFMDNIELNSAYRYRDNAIIPEDAVKIRDGFFEYMNKYAKAVTGDSDAQVYFYSEDVRVPKDGLDVINKVTSFTGNISQEKVYVNAARCSGVNIEKLNQQGRISWIVVPKSNNDSPIQNESMFDMNLQYFASKGNIKSGTNITQEGVHFSDSNIKLKLGYEYEFDLSEYSDLIDNLENGEIIKIGRSNECDIMVPAEEKAVSRFHLTITKEKDGILIKDNNSTNGTTFISKTNSDVSNSKSENSFGKSIINNLKNKFSFISKEKKQPKLETPVKEVSYNDRMVPDDEIIRRVEKLSEKEISDLSRVDIMIIGEMSDETFESIIDFKQKYNLDYQKAYSLLFDAHIDVNDKNVVDVLEKGEILGRKIQDINCIDLNKIIKMDTKTLEKVEYFCNQNNSLSMAIFYAKQFKNLDIAALKEKDSIIGAKANISENLSRYVAKDTWKYSEIKYDDFIKAIEQQLDMTYSPNIVWGQHISENMDHSAWKMHIYAENETELMQLVETCGQYLSDNDIAWKTLKSGTTEEFFSSESGEQAGKAITIYPHSVEEFEKIAKDIDSIIRANNLQTEGKKIIGDRQLAGSSGRIFYRYEFFSKNYKDENGLVVDCLDRNFKFDISENIELYQKLYEANRGNDNYLADDMTEEDDPFRNFNASN